MKTAQGSISVDVSQFNSSIDSAKAKLTSFGSSLSKIGSVASTAWKAFDAVAGVSEKISTIIKAGRDLQSVFNALPTIMSKVSSAFNGLKSLGSQLASVFSKLPTSVKVLGTVSIATAGSIFVLVKAIQGLYAISKSAISTVGSLVGKIADMGKSALKATGGIISSSFSGFGSVLKGVAIGVAGLATAFAGLSIFVANGVKGIFELGDGYKTLRDRTGASIPFIYGLEKAFKANGVSAEMVGPALNNMQKALSGLNEQGEPTNKWFEKLNLRIEDLQKLSPQDQFKVIAKAITQLESPAQRTAASMGIFGRAGASMIGAFKEVDSIGDKLDPSAKILEQNAERFSRISTKLKESGNFFKGFFIAIAGSIAPELERILKLMEGGDFMTGIGQKLGDQLKFALDVFIGALESGSIGEILQMSFEFAIIYFKDLFKRTSNYVASYLNVLLSTDALKGLSSGLIDVLSGSIKVVGSMLLKAFETPIAYFQTGIEFAVLYAQKAFDSMFKNWKEIGTGFAKGGAIGGAIAAGKALIKDNSLPNNSDFEKMLKEKLETGVKFGLGSLQVNSKNVDSAIEQIGKGAKKAFEGAKTGINALKTADIKFGKESQETKKSFEALQNKLKTMAEAGKTSGAFIGPMQPEGKGTALNPIVTTPKTASDAISSLQRIGGGGGGLGLDPLLNVNQRQLDESKKQTDIFKNIEQKFGRFSGITEAQGAVLGR
jgi:hypothetical protein